MSENPGERLERLDPKERHVEPRSVENSFELAGTLRLTREGVNEVARRLRPIHPVFMKELGLV
jgi:hypothetical protein